MDDKGLRTLLVVDDAPDNLAFMHDILSDMYRVKVANNGEKALRIAGSASPPDLILLDIMMPGLSGYDVCRKLKSKARTRDIPIIFLTALTDVTDEQAGFELGAADYIFKPVNPAVLCVRIKTHLSLKLSADVLRNKNLDLEQEVERRIRENRKTEEQLLQSQKMEAIGQFAGGVAHDFNNILMVIMGYGSLLQLDDQLGDKHKQEIQRILDAVDRAAQLTGGLLAFSRKQEVSVKQTDLNTIILRVQGFLERVIGEEIQLMVTLHEQGTLPVAVDSNQIEQVLINLASNARDAMSGCGKLLIESGIQEVEAPLGEGPDLFRPGYYAWLAVSDSGAGMDADTKRRIFEPFYTTKEIGKGTGLGLAIVHGIIRQHNGIIHVNSEPGIGTTFRVYLPLDSSGQKLHGVKEESAVPFGGEGTILLAEDDPAVRILLVTLLNRFGYEVIQACNGEDAVTLFTDNRDRIDLIVMDIFMPKKNGVEAYSEICRIQDGVAVLYLSGYSAEFLSDRGIGSPGLEVLMKPLQPMELLRRVQEKLDSRH